MTRVVKRDGRIVDDPPPPRPCPPCRFTYITRVNGVEVGPRRCSNCGAAER